MKNIHYLSSIYITCIKNVFCHLERLINMENAHPVLIELFQVKCHHSVPLRAALYHCMVLLNDDVTCYQ